MHLAPQWTGEELSNSMPCLYSSLWCCAGLQAGDALPSVTLYEGTPANKVGWEPPKTNWPQRVHARSASVSHLGIPLLLPSHILGSWHALPADLLGHDPRASKGGRNCCWPTEQLKPGCSLLAAGGDHRPFQGQEGEGADT